MKDQNNEEKKCDGCKLFESMGVHSFTCPIRKETIEVSFSSPEVPSWTEKIKKAYIGEYSGILSEEVIEKSANWLINFIEKELSKEISSSEQRWYERGREEQKADCDLHTTEEQLKDSWKSGHLAAKQETLQSLKEKVGKLRIRHRDNCYFLNGGRLNECDCGATTVDNFSYNRGVQDSMALLENEI